MKYCPYCKRMVKPVKKFSWLAFFLCLGVFYLPYYFLFKRKECPFCGARDLLDKEPESEEGA
jgi:sarcosine oxidase delta subunit